MLSDRQIQALCQDPDRPPMIMPFIDHKARTINDQPAISFGLGHYGYDVRLGNEFKWIKKNASTIDPKKDNEAKYVTVSAKTSSHLLLPGQSVLAHTMEYLRIPKDMQGIVYGKSTYARVGLIVNCTPLEPGWEGQITLELVNTNLNCNLRLYIGEGIAQVVFYRADEVCAVGYDDAGDGKYQGQMGAVIARV